MLLIVLLISYPKIAELKEGRQSEILNIRIVEKLAHGQRIICVKIQSPVITDTADICQNSENSEKFEVQISNIRIPNRGKACPWSKNHPCENSVPFDH